MRKYTHSLLLVLALFFAALVGYVDLHSDDMFIVAGLAVGCAFVLSAIQPQWFWQWGVLVGLGIPLTETIARVGNIPVPYTTEPPTLLGELLVFAVSFVLSFTGAIGGTVVRRVIWASDVSAW